MLEEIPHRSPGEVVQRRGGRDTPTSSKNQRGNEVFQRTVGVFLGSVEDDHGSDGAKEEEEEQAGVDLARAEHSGGADEAPDHGGGEEDSPARAGEVFGLGGCADILDRAEGVVEHRDLDEAGEGGCHDLAHEHGPRGDLHVVPELEVAYEAEGLGHCYVAEGFEAGTELGRSDERGGGGIGRGERTSLGLEVGRAGYSRRRTRLGR